jgi:deoxyribodipyrimidine photo-lyase
LQTPGKTYVARADNIAHYTEGRHVPASGRLATSPIALTEEPIPKVPAWTQAPESFVGLAVAGPVGLWLHSEDLAVERGELAGLDFAAINASWPVALAASAGWSPKVADWTRMALVDGARRCGAHFGSEVSAAETSDLSASIVDWARKHQLQSVVAFRPFVGPWLTEALAIESALA